MRKGVERNQGAIHTEKKPPTTKSEAYGVAPTGDAAIRATVSGKSGHADHHVDGGLGPETGNCRTADVLDPHTRLGEHRRQPRPLAMVRRGPLGIIIHEHEGDASLLHATCAE